mmetsp:Transcript_19082/g.26685  ORF Transcript_19082/g.26685 Transcript_19082/m.26685 type:complete len:840 (+) Transcript_19082:103-2622(+)
MGSMRVARSPMFVVTAFLFLLFLGISASPVLDVHFGADGEFRIDIDGIPSFQSGGVLFRSNGKSYGSQKTVASYALRLIRSETGTGIDTFGKYKYATNFWDADGVPGIMKIRVYEAGFCIFEQSYPEGLSTTNIDDRDGVITSFPSFKLGKIGNNKRGFLAYNGHFAGSQYITGLWEEEAASKLPYGLEGTGPIAVFSPERGGPCAILSAFSSFMSVNQYVDQNAQVLRFGLMGSTTFVPKNYTLSTILFVGRGINSAMQAWGDILLTNYKKDRTRSREDFATKYLGYSTAKGGYYYYRTEEGKTYEETILDLKNVAEESKIPIRYWLMDSWWYYKGLGQGVKKWEAFTGLFPNGLANLYNKTKWPVVAHNKYWTPDVVYAKQNGGKWNFIIEEEKALPTELGFWSELFNVPARSWGLVTYEQDWLIDAFQGMNCTLESPTFAREWLFQMAQGAGVNNITIEYCNPWSRFVLQSVEFQQVTSLRASDDYKPRNNQWEIGVTSIFADALGLIPIKDNFRSASPNHVVLQEEVRRAECKLNIDEYGEEMINQVLNKVPTPAICSAIELCNTKAGCILCEALVDKIKELMEQEKTVSELLQFAKVYCLRYPKDIDDHEPHRRLEAAVSTLSMGPVTPSDASNSFDRDLIMRSCREDGTILRPDVPAKMIDSAIVSMVFKDRFNGTEAGNIWASHTYLSGFDYAQVLAARSTDFEVFYEDLFKDNVTYAAFEVNDTNCLHVIGRNDKIALPSTDAITFQLWNLSPVLPSGWALLGETDKWVSVSSARFSNVSSTKDGLIVHLKGVVGENVTVAAWSKNGGLKVAHCVLPNFLATISFPTCQCS